MWLVPHLGYQHQFGSIVVGVEGNWNTAIRDKFDETTCPNPAFRCSARFDDVLSVGPRIGWAAGHWMAVRKRHRSSRHARTHLHRHTRVAAAAATLFRFVRPPSGTLLIFECKFSWNAGASQR